MENAINEAKIKMDKALEALKSEIAVIRTGRASLSILDGIKVDYYGTPTPLNQVANLKTPDPRLITIQPWEAKILGEIEKSILKSGLGLTPTNDGKMIRLNIPTPSEEGRKELVKMVKKHAEECRVAIRMIRRDANETLKKREKEKAISEDDLKRGEERVQKLTDDYSGKIDELVAHKEKEILSI